MSTLATLTARFPGFPEQVTAPMNHGFETIKAVQHKASLAGHRKIVRSKMFMLTVAYSALYRTAEYLIPDDAYDWEDDAVAEFLGEDLNA